MPFARPVFLFPGQGAQSVGMGTSLPQASAAARQTMDAAHAAAGFDLPGLCARGPAELLERTEYQQPCVLAVSAAAYFAFRERHDVAPVAAIGHSLGEYTALVAAGVLDVADAVRLTRKRGAYMQEAVPEGEGAMAALLGASATQAEQICVEAGGEVWVANENGGGQVVISGKAADVERARDAAKKYGVRRSVPLPVSAPFHCPLMKPAATRLGADLAAQKFGAFSFPVIANVDARENNDPSRVASLLEKQVTGRVLFEKCLARALELGADSFIEFGPGGKLTGMAARVYADIPRLTIAEPGDLEKVAMELSA